MDRDFAWVPRGSKQFTAYIAGRILVRNVAKTTLSLAEFRAQMKGRTWLDRNASALLDEAPGAGKSIEQVIADSADLIETVTVLRQFINYNGLYHHHVGHDW